MKENDLKEFRYLFHENSESGHWVCIEPEDLKKWVDEKLREYFAAGQEQEKATGYYASEGPAHVYQSYEEYLNE